MDKVTVPKYGEWPGVLGAYRLVRPVIKNRIWDFVSLVGLNLIAGLVIDIIATIIFGNRSSQRIFNDILINLVFVFFESAIIYLYFGTLRGNNSDKTLSDILKESTRFYMRMIGLAIVMDVLLIVSLVLLVIPFFFVMPRIILAPFFLIDDDLPVDKALAASWHLTKGHAGEIYGIIGLNLLIALLFLTIIGIPFAIYFFIINNASCALLLMYLANPKMKKIAKT